MIITLILIISFCTKPDGNPKGDQINGGVTNKRLAGWKFKTWPCYSILSFVKKLHSMGLSSFLFKSAIGNL